MTTTINGRTPLEIKQGLECCLVCRDYRDCLICPYGTPRKRGVLPCECEVKQDILALINQLLEDKKQLERERDEARNDLDTINYANTELHSAYEAMKRERDAAVKDMRELISRMNAGEDVMACEYCAKRFGVCNCNCLNEFELRGVEVVN